MPQAQNQHETFKFTKFTSTGIATKRIRYEDGKLVSDKRPELSRGLGEVIRTTLDKFPEILNGLSSNQAISCGVPVVKTDKFRLMTKAKMMAEFGTPLLQDETGTTLARLAENFEHNPYSLMVFDHDPDPEHQKIAFQTPADFVAWLAELCPDFKDVAYVAKYSTSSHIQYQGKQVREASGFHVYFLVKRGTKTQEEINTHLMQQAWLKGYGYIAVSKAGSTLTRVPMDLSVAQTNRIMYEAKPELETEGLTQDNQAWFVEGAPFVNVTFAKPNSNSKTKNLAKEVEIAILREKQSDTIQQKIAGIKKTAIATGMSKYGYTRSQAEAAFEYGVGGTLDLNHTLFFDDGRQATVLEVISNWPMYDKATLSDPLEPEKGANKAQFFANEMGANPVIHSFVRHEVNYYLNDSFVASAKIQESDQAKFFNTALNAKVLETGFDPTDRYFDFELPQANLIGLIGDQGTGKTQQIARWKDEGKLGKVLSIAPRIALVVANAQRLGVSAYCDDEVQGQNSVLAEGLATTLDSLYKFKHYAVDTLFLDEFEQNIEHLTAKTLKNHRAIIDTLRLLCHRAKRIIVADADLSANTIKLMKDLGIFPNNREFEITVLLNHYKACEGGVIHVVDTQIEILAKIDQCVEKGEGVYIATNKKGDVHRIVRYLLHKFSAQKSGYRYRHGDFLIPLTNGQRLVIVTKDNSGQDLVGQFCSTINDNLKCNDILLTSPSLSTGVSIDIEFGVPKLQNRFLILSSNVGTRPSDAVQHLERIRGGGQCQTFVYCDNAERHLSTNPSEILEQDRYGTVIEFFRNQSLFVSNQLLYSRKNVDNNLLDQMYDHIYGYVKSRTNAELNNYRIELISRLSRKGYIIRNTQVAVSSDVSETNKEVRLEQKMYLRTLDIQAPILTEEEEVELNAKNCHTIEETHMLKKTHLSRLLGTNQQQTDELMAYSTTQVKALQDAMLLAMSDRRAVQLDMCKLVRESTTLADIDSFYAKKQYAIEILSWINVTFTPQGIVQCDASQFSTDDINALYDKLYNLNKDPLRPKYQRIKSLFNTSVPYTEENKERGKIVSNMYRKLGIYFSRTTFRDANDKSKHCHIKMVNTEWLQVLQTTMKRAINGSRHTWFANEISVPAELMQYRLDKQQGIHSSDKITELLSGLQGEYNEALEDLITSGIFKLKDDEVLARK